MNRERRVLVLNHFAAPRGEAGGTRHVELFGRLRNWEYQIIASDLNPQTGRRVQGEPGLAVVHVPKYSSNGLHRILNWIAYSWRATLLGVRQRNIDVVYGSSPHLLAAAAAWLIAAVRRKPFVMEVRDLWPQVLVDMGTLAAGSAVFKVLTRVEMFLYERASAIVVMAEGTRSELISRGVPPDKLHYIPNGADPEDFEPSAPRNELRTRYGFDKFTAIYAGAHGPANGLDALLDAAKTLKDLNLTVVLVGGGISKEALVRRASAEDIWNVRFMDPVAKTEIADILAAADLGLHVLADVPLFHSAVSPNKVFDYMAAGLPVLTNCPGLVSDTVNGSGAGIGVLPSSIGLGIRSLMSDGPAERKAMGDSGMQWLRSHQSRARMADRLQRVLESARRTG